MALRLLAALAQNESEKEYRKKKKKKASPAAEGVFQAAKWVLFVLNLTTENNQEGRWVGGSKKKH